MSSEVQSVTDAAVEVYEPGVGLGEVAKAGGLRFLPASLLSVFAVSAVLIGWPLSGARLMALPLIVGALAGGFSAGLALLRGYLYPDANVAGRRSVVAGLVSPLLMFTVMTLAPELGLVPALGVFGIVGIVVAVVMFFAWLTPTPEEMRAARADDAL